MRIYLREDNENINSVLTIDEQGISVEHCDENAESVEVPDGIQYICEAAFAECRKLNHIVFPEGLYEIGFNAFEGCVSLTEVTIPSSVDIIFAASFMSCRGLRKVNILSKRTRIAFSAFYGEEDNVVMSCDGVDFTMGDLRRVFPQYDWESDMYDNDELWYDFFYVGQAIEMIKEYREQDKQNESDIANGIKPDWMIADENDLGF